MPVKMKMEAELPSAIRVDLGAIFVSLELSKSTWLVTALARAVRRCRATV